MALYLSAVIGAETCVTSVVATSHDVTIAWEARQRMTARVSFPRAVRAFAEAFEAGFYPHMCI